ncbi:hypothetical protein Hypma_006561 [Hypsizygus marmoreus]|uniref:Uncharacterized protein n=1 Tax=Hypsizygus marmoreus TaxID=39966 RepID=A0A369JXA6_HYPMA|nr:hypothetical protein Hypma_006561 [Hypsizygus marmoreus]
MLHLSNNNFQYQNFEKATDTDTAHTLIRIYCAIITFIDRLHVHPHQLLSPRYPHYKPANVAYFKLQIHGRYPPPGKYLRKRGGSIPKIRHDQEKEFERSL